jgi:hypothetical protein
MRIVHRCLPSVVVHASVCLAALCCNAKGASIIPDAELSGMRGGKLTTYSDCVPATTSTCPGTFQDCTAVNGNNQGRDCIACGSPLDGACGSPYAHSTPVKTDCGNTTPACGTPAGAVVYGCNEGSCSGLGGKAGFTCSATNPDCTPPK